MAKLIIPAENLPDLNAYTGSIDLRFRIVTNDRNSLSYWSPVYSINPTKSEDAGPSVGPTSFGGSGSILIDNKVSYVSIVWNPVEISNNLGTYSTLENYDVWVRLGSQLSGGSWDYSGRINATNTNVIIPYDPLGYSYISVEIYRPAKPALRISKTDVYQNSTYIDISTDTIMFPLAHNFVTGEALKYTSIEPVGGLTNGSTYYVKVTSPSNITLHSTKNDAIGNTNKINITSNKNELAFFAKQDCPACDFLIYSKYNFSLI